MGNLGKHLATLGPPTLEHLQASRPGHSGRGDGGALLYLFETPEGSLLYQDTSGHWSGILDGLGPDGIAARVIDVTRGVVRLQTGYLYHYAFAMLIGAAALITWFMFAGGGAH